MGNNDYSHFTIVIPTLDEKGTIGALVRRIEAEYAGARVIVVDDGSGDGTKEAVEALAKRYRNVMLIDRHGEGRPRGLTASVVEGIEKCSTKYFVVMDADMQHPLEKVRRLADMLEKGYDAAVAERESVTGWALYRKIISKALILIGQLVLNARGKEACGDIFSGFFGMRRSLFMRVHRDNRQRFVGEGYKVLFDFLKCVDKGTLRIGEVPYVFRVRESGRSKAGYRQGIALLKSFVS